MTKHKTPRVRSPSYPYINLEVAITKLRDMYNFTHKTPVMVATILPRWGYETGKSANGMKMVAALKSFGLIDAYTQDGKRKVVITDIGFRVINLESGSESSIQLIKECALKPEMYRYMWNYYDELPHFEAIKAHLVVDKRFNEGAVKGFLNDYKHTIEYANLSKNDTLDGEQGVNSELGVPKEKEQKNPIPSSKAKNTGEKMGISDNERELISGLLPENIRYRIIVTGDLGPKEIGKLIRLLEAQRDVLSDDD